jgi:hypothetical protein
MFVATRAGSRRCLPAVQGTIIGLTFGLIDIHSKEGDRFNSKALLVTDPFFRFQHVLLGPIQPTGI